MSSDTSTVSLELDSRPQSVALVRGLLSTVLELLGLGPELRDDVNTAASEACNNVVLHAYGEGVGPLHVGVELGAQNLVVVVRDHGVGLTVRTPSDDRLGVGFAMMSALATRAQFRDSVRGGTEVRLTFACDALWTRTVGGSLPTFAPLATCPALIGDAVVPSCPIPFLPAVMGRLATMVAARARFSLDRLSDLRLLTDAICAQARIGALDERIGFALAGALRRLELAVGPLGRGTGDRLSHTDWLTSASLVPLRLADDVTLEQTDGYEIMRIVMTDESPRHARA